ncbi:hypothetical protein [Natronococcus jeotgali]|uniref:Uncharacterized protein n=1 Tax=Natronococcus jeotgali DSM 18795 TaxID=1227498 RepID=L9WM63_9EURY|nr:hypothetical protein [Natronococcus jeotgali]ELY50560.1 hypothetical protein C492_22332 [Natronococcus jeotgali DSM 18795]
MTAPRNLSRRTALTTIGALAAVPALGTGAVGACSASASSEGAQRYVGVVDRIVDGRHVVVLLEADNRVVDQLVVDVDEFDEIAPRDILLVVLEDGELARYRHLPEKPASTGRP